MNNFRDQSNIFSWTPTPCMWDMNSILKQRPSHKKIHRWLDTIWLRFISFTCAVNLLHSKQNYKSSVQSPKIFTAPWNQLFYAYHKKQVCYMQISFSISSECASLMQITAAICLVQYNEANSTKKCQKWWLKIKNILYRSSIWYVFVHVRSPGQS